MEERRRIQKKQHERSPEGKSQTDGWDQKLVEWDQDLVSQINNVKVSICTLREKRKQGEGEMEENVTAVLSGVWDHMISLDISVKSRAPIKINEKEETKERTNPTNTTHITTAAPGQPPRDDWNEWGECFACAPIHNGKWAQNHRRNLELNKIFCGGIGMEECFSSPEGIKTRVNAGEMGDLRSHPFRNPVSKSDRGNARVGG